MHAGFFRKNLHNKPSASSSAQQQSTSTTDPADLDPLFEAVDPAAFKKSDLQAERLFGLENFGNTCYANSVVQALFFCEPFRTYVVQAYPNTPIAQVLSVHNLKEGGLTNGSPGGASALPPSSPTNGSRKSSLQGNPLHPVAASTASSSLSPTANGSPPSQDAAASDDPGDVTRSPDPAAAALPPLEFKPSTMLTTLRDLFVGMALHKDRKGVIAPEAFITQLRRESEFFRSASHQDAHEFLNYLLNMIADEAEKEIKATQKEIEQQDQVHQQGATDADSSYERQRKSLMRSVSTLSWVHQLFQGTLTNETLCLGCKNISSRDETFLDLSIDIEENSSVSSCLRQFSASELLVNKNQFSCDPCGSLQDAERRMKIKHSPDVLSLHLKRFKWQENLGQFTKLFYRVVFPFELRLFNTVDDSPDLDRLYYLWAVVVHVGSGPTSGHYVTLVKSMGRWLLFDDEDITPIEESEISRYYGDNPKDGAAYVLFYQAADISTPRGGSRRPSAIDEAAESANSEEDGVEQLEEDVVPPLASSVPDSSTLLQRARTAAEAPVKERRSILGIPGMRRSFSSKTDLSTNHRPKTAPEAVPPAPTPADLHSLNSQNDLSDSSSSPSAQVMQSRGAQGGGPGGGLTVDVTPPQPAFAGTEPPSPTQGTEKRSFGRFFTRTKSFRRKSQSQAGAVTPTTEGGAFFGGASEPSASSNPTLQASTSGPPRGEAAEAQQGPVDASPSATAAALPLGKKEMKTQQKEQKEQAKREKEETKQRAKREKEEAKRLKKES